MQEKSERRTQDARSAAMRARLIAAARSLFAARGFAATGTPEIVAAAGVTRGALYHHFADKADLLRAVVEAESAEVATRIAAAEVSPEAPFAAGTRAFFDAMAAPGRARLLLVEGPAALGPAVMAEIDAGFGGATLRDGLAAAIPAADPAEIVALAALLSAGFDRAALALDAGADPGPYHAALARIFRALLPGETGS
jgi:AcrR family transcriptional regulator